MFVTAETGTGWAFEQMCYNVTKNIEKVFMEIMLILCAVYVTCYEVPYI